MRARSMCVSCVNTKCHLPLRLSKPPSACVENISLLQQSRIKIVICPFFLLCTPTLPPSPGNLLCSFPTCSEQQLEVPLCYHADKAELRREEQGTGYWSLSCRATASNSLPAAPRLAEICFSTHVPSSCSLVATPSTSPPSLLLCFSSIVNWFKSLTPQRLHGWTSWRVT